MTDAAVPSRVSAWRYALSTTNPPDRPIDAVTRWIVVFRALMNDLYDTRAAIAAVAGI